jgi:DNA invertase Pin-like site-specific DNA recombinase
MKPYAKAQTLKYIGLQDRRRKLKDEQRAEILKIRQETGAGYRTIAKQFNVSRSLVRIICDPAAAARVSARMAEHWREYKMTKKRGASECAHPGRENTAYTRADNLASHT